MLYDPDTALSRDEQSTRDAEAILAAQLAQLSVASPSGSLADKQRFTHFLTDKHFRLPHLVVRFGTQLIQNAAGKLGNAVWDMYERVCLASLDCHDYAVSTWSLGMLEAQWGKSSARVSRLRAMLSEARGHLSTADESYAKQLEADPTNALVMRRQIAVAKAAGELGSAIALLNKFLKLNPSDESGWWELSELYATTNQYELASFAAEELLLLAPENYLVHIRYAELCYTLGQFDTARAYYAQSLELKPNQNLRALYGLQLCLRQPGKANAAASNQGAKVSPQALHAWSLAQLEAHYAKFAPQLAQVMRESLSGESTAAVAAPAAAAITASASAAAPAASDDVDEPNTPQEADLPD